jgi:hypothetical protein
MAHRTQKIYRNVRTLSRQGEATKGSFGAFFMPYENNEKRRTEQFGALRLFSSVTNRKRKYVEEKTMVI